MKPMLYEDVVHPAYGRAVMTIDDLDMLDPDEMLEGYREGRAGEPEPGGNRSRAHWHGWHNGAVDGGHREKDVTQAVLAAVVHRASWLERQSTSLGATV